MTQQKARKQRVRARMASTGERYTTARAQLLAREHSAAESPTRPTQPLEPVPTAVPDAPAGSGHGHTDQTLIARTGQDWAYWYGLLDAWDATGRTHTEIARWLVEEHAVDGWWAQSITVRYELAIGRREPGQRSDGFEATAARTFAAAPSAVYEAIVDDGRRLEWLAEPMTLRKANQNRTTSAFGTIRFDWREPGQRVVFWLADKGERTTVSVAHQRLPDRATTETMKAFWRERLKGLGTHLDRGR